MNRGFTLIELLVVVSIIGILASIVLVSLGGARGKGRDAQRKGTLHEVATALELYAAKNGAYPSTGATGATGPARCTLSMFRGSGNTCDPNLFLSQLISDGDLSSTLVDPSDVNGGWPWQAGCSGYYYYYMSNGTHYILGGFLENANDPMTLNSTDVVDPFAPANKLRASDSYCGNAFVFAQ